MTRSEFTKKLGEVIETEMEINEQTRLRDIPEYSSLTALSIIVFINDEFSKRINTRELNALTTVESLMKFIGMENFS